jgi:hypothetical protein
MKKLVPIFLLACGVCLWAADFWEAKPFTDWADKDIQKLMTNSPWAKSIGVPISGPAAVMAGGAVGGAGGDGTEPPTPQSERGGGGGRGGRGGGGNTAGVGDLGGASADVVLRWFTAMPIKQAMLRIKYGAEAGTSSDAKAALDRAEANYIIVVTGRPLVGVLRGNPDAIKQAIMEKTTLSVKGKTSLKPSEIQLLASGQGQGKAKGPPSPDLYFVFPKTTPITLEDKEVEFATKIGDISLKNKFQLKSMVFNGKLEL